jgi:hypothetical protein
MSVGVAWFPCLARDHGRQLQPQQRMFRRREEAPHVILYKAHAPARAVQLPMTPRALPMYCTCRGNADGPSAIALQLWKVDINIVASCLQPLQFHWSDQLALQWQHTATRSSFISYAFHRCRVPFDAAMTLKPRSSDVFGFATTTAKLTPRHATLHCPAMPNLVPCVTHICSKH